MNKIIIKKQISNISGHQTSKILALMSVLFTVPFVLFGIFAFIALPMKTSNGETVSQFMGLSFVLVPIFYGCIGYIFTRLSCIVYNFISKRFGGIEFTVTESKDS